MFVHLLCVCVATTYDCVCPFPCNVLGWKEGWLFSCCYSYREVVCKERSTSGHCPWIVMFVHGVCACRLLCRHEKGPALMPAIPVAAEDIWALFQYKDAVLFYLILPAWKTPMVKDRPSPRSRFNIKITYLTSLGNAHVKGKTAGRTSFL